jgi:hypothetical protein
MVDTFAHGIISYLGFGRNKNIKKKDRVKTAWLSVFFGVLPDLSSWTIYLIYRLFNGGFGRPDPSIVPDWVMTLYGISHSILIFAAVIGIVYIIKKTIPIYLWAWGLHIAIDVPTHSRDFLPTPFLWPVADWYFPGISWGRIFWHYWTLILIWIIALVYLEWKNKKHKK